jgi:xylulokinase
LFLLGIDLGTSSIKASLVDARSGAQVAAASSPEQEMAMNAPQPGWAEQDPELWWEHTKQAIHKIISQSRVDSAKIGSIGIAYQMHGLVIVDRNHKVLRPAIIWCDGRAVKIGERAYRMLGEDFCKQHFLNSPGNFTASKLRWVQENEPEIYEKIYKFMLPGDYIGMKLTGEIVTSFSGLSEGILWDYKKHAPAQELLDYYDIDASIVPESVPNFSEQGQLTQEVASEVGIKKGTSVTYRAGDQPNNALSLNVLQPGQAAATAGTSGVIYGVTDRPLFDESSRVNTFIHVNHRKDRRRYGILLCINGTGIQYSWMKNTLFDHRYSYRQMNEKASEIPIGSEGICVLPFGNGPERILENQDIGAHIQHINFNRHSDAHLMRAAQEGIAFSFSYGLKIMQQIGLSISTIRAGSDNLFQSEVFREAFTNTTGINIKIYDTNGSFGAAVGAGLGDDIFSNRDEAFRHLNQIAELCPDPDKQAAYQSAYTKWENILQKELRDVG